MSAPAIARVLVITPRLDGMDGVSEVSRQAVDACAGVVGTAATEVWALDGSESSSDVRSAGGRGSRLARWAVAEATRRADGLLVFVLHLHLLPVALPLALRGARLACFLHGIEAWRRVRPRERAALSCAAAVVANSRWTADRFRGANPDLAHVPIAVCPLGVREGPSPEFPSCAGYALIVGRLAAAERYKGHDRLIEIWRDVVTEVPSAMLAIVGDGDDRARLETLALDRGVASNVLFAGRVSDREREGFYRNAAFFVMPSTGEGFGLAYLEAMRAGKPCIAAPGAAAEIIEDGTTGLIVDPASRADLAAAIVRLFKNRELTRSMGRQASDRVAACFEARHFAARLLAPLGLASASAAVR